MLTYQERKKPIDSEVTTSKLMVRVDENIGFLDANSRIFCMNGDYTWKNAYISGEEEAL